jgi:hypothetical protein
MQTLTHYFRYCNRFIIRVYLDVNNLKILKYKVRFLDRKRALRSLYLYGYLYED